jgi:hypothetical protein
MGKYKVSFGAYNDYKTWVVIPSIQLEIGQGQVVIAFGWLCSVVGLKIER